MQTDKRASVPAINTNSHVTKPSRVSSEPPRKISAKLLLPLQENQGHSMHNQLVLSSGTHQQLHDTSIPINSSAKSNSNIYRNENYVNALTRPSSGQVIANESNELSAQGSSVVIYKLDLTHRIKSASSHKSQSTAAISDSDVIAGNNNELSLSAVPCLVQQANRSSKQILKSQNRRNSNESNDQKLSVLSSIYGAVYETADKITAQVESLKKVKKIFLSDKQSGTLRENGMEYPCAPPATPTPGIYTLHLL